MLMISKNKIVVSEKYREVIMNRIVKFALAFIVIMGIGFLISGIMNNKPPAPLITVEGKTIPAKQGTYCWNGFLNIKCVDMISPPELIKFYDLEPVAVPPESQLKLDFRKKPNAGSLGANLWLNDIEMREVNLVGNILTAPKQSGVYVYDIHARWDKGSSSYVFIIEVK